MQESVVEHVPVRLGSVIEEMVSSGDVVALVPVDLPLTKDWVPGVDVKLYFVLVSERSRCGNVANVVIVVEASNVSGQSRANSLPS